MFFSSGLRKAGGFLMWIVLPLLVGLLLAVQFAPRPAVGLVRVRGDIWSGSVELVLAEIEEARRDPRVKAVVVQLDSPGGEVVASQTLFLELQKLRQEMPVVGSIDNVAASGAYYAAMGVDPLYAKPSSVVGNVGVWSFAPPELAVNDEVLASGPFKLTASNRDQFLREIEGIKQEFLATVTSQRGERLKISAVDLSQGLAYPGREALQLGLIDALGPQTEAVEAAARQAGITNYEVVDLEARIIEEWYGTATETTALKPWSGAPDPATGARQIKPGVYLLYDVYLGGQP